MPTCRVNGPALGPTGNKDIENTAALSNTGRLTRYAGCYGAFEYWKMNTSIGQAGFHSYLICAYMYKLKREGIHCYF